MQVREARIHTSAGRTGRRHTSKRCCVYSSTTPARLQWGVVASAGSQHRIPAVCRPSHSASWRGPAYLQSRALINAEPRQHTLLNGERHTTKCKGAQVRDSCSQPAPRLRALTLAKQMDTLFTAAGRYLARGKINNQAHGCCWGLHIVLAYGH